MGNYDDIINLPHPESTKHPRMSALDRAAQFSPFAALTGYEDAIAETARLTDTRPELDDIGHKVILKNGTIISINDIYEIEGSIFE